MEKQAYIMCDYSLLFRLTDEKHGSKIIEKAGAMIDTFHCRQKNNAVLAFLAFISLLFESYFFPLRKIYRILKKKREMIKKAENK